MINLPDCPDCGRGLAHVENGIGACHECNARYQVGQCEGCDDPVTEEAATAESVPGATLWWCPDCAMTNRERGRWA
jgi:hypothetical protein